MTNYPLKEVAEFSTYEGGKCGLMIRCPNCGMLGSVFFSKVIDGDTEAFLRFFPGKPLWERTGETLETISLTPSVAMIGHFHSWVKNGVLVVDSEFACQKQSTKEN
jgi:hypothetical protein